MDIKKWITPVSHKGDPLPYAEGEYIFFKVEYNGFRDLSNSRTTEVRDRYEPAECEAVLRLPESYREQGEKTQLVIFCHGAKGTVSEKENHVGGIPACVELLKRGYAIMDVNGSHPDGLTMGNPEHIHALYKAYKHAIRHYNLTERVLIGGASMGGSTAMNFANTFPSLVIAAGLYYPRLHIDGVWVGDHYCIGTWDKVNVMHEGLSTHDRVARNFHFPGDTYCAENTVGFNPYYSRSFVNSDGQRVIIPPCPIKIWQGDADTAVDPVFVEEYVNCVRRGGGYIELHMLEGVPHTTTPTVREELGLWFDRFV
ncbi:MAG: alpha/beta hydrolase [Oscillospiraceae bacterium]|nr:alpha/beta hydrolase [Oscillospiraceae bacterium]